MYFKTLTGGKKMKNIFVNFPTKIIFEGDGEIEARVNFVFVAGDVDKVGRRRHFSSKNIWPTDVSPTHCLVSKMIGRKFTF
jgi:hypothetical protein